MVNVEVNASLVRPLDRLEVDLRDLKEIFEYFLSTRKDQEVYSIDVNLGRVHDKEVCRHFYPRLYISIYSLCETLMKESKA